MRRILTLVLIVSMVLGTALPVVALAAAPIDNGQLTMDNDGAAEGGGSESEEADAGGGDPVDAGDGETGDNSGETDPVNPPLGESGPDDEAPVTENDGGLPFDPSYEATEDGGFVSIMPLSGFEGEGSEFFTKIRLAVTDRQGNPIQGAVYGLYRADNDQLVELLTTDRYGVATSGDVPVDTDYYLLEYTTPEGFLPNEERKDIILAEVCAPSRVDVTAVYDPIMGEIEVIKEDEQGNRIPGVGFYVYRVSGWVLVDTIYTDEYGVARTTQHPYGEYELYEFYAPDDFVTGGYYTVYIDSHEETVEIEITNYRATGSARVYKTGNDERMVQDAVYSIYRVGDSDEWVCDITTNSSGYAYAYNLSMGAYYAVEKSVPAPYKLNTEQKHFTLSSNGQWAYLDFVNEVDGEAGRLRLLKTDDSENPLSGVGFGLFRTWDSKRLATLTTGSDGVAEYSPLIPGDYYLVEETGKPGYTMVTERIPFMVDGSGATVELTVENPRIKIFGKVKAVKKDDAGSPVEGVRIGVFCHKGNLLEELTTGPDGTATSGILNEGTGYYLQELEGVAGYLSSDEQYPFDITQNGAIVSVNIVNPRISGGVWVIKSGDSDEALPGVGFGVYQGGYLVERLTTDEDGTAESGTLYYGDYELIELSTVEGYELIDTPIPFSITEDGVVIEIPVTNPLIMGTIIVMKVDDTSDDGKDGETEDENEDEGQQESAPSLPAGAQPLAGAVFGLYNEQGQKLAELTTGEDGTASHSLPKGIFTLKELAAPEGFLVSDELIHFTIETQGQVVEKIVVNAQGFGTIQVVKSGDNGEENEPLPGVAFDVFRTATEEKAGELLIDENGEAELTLPLGRYYLVETTTAEGFQLLPGRVSFTLTEDEATVELPIANQRIPDPDDGGIRLTKTSTAGVLLPNAGFGVCRAGDDERVGALTTGPDGTASISLPAGDYYLLEEAAPEGFLPITEKIPVTVEEAVYTALTVENEPEPPATGEARVVKHASGTGVRLPDARFGVYDAATDEKAGEIVTGENGVGSLTLPAGDFYLLELEAPDGFQKLTEPISFQVEAGETTRLTIPNDPVKPEPESPGTVRFVKKAANTSARLPEAVIGVYRADNDVKLAELTTDSEGVAEYTLAAGDYYWKELRAPEGFTLIEGKTAFTVTEDKTIEIVIVNDPLPADTGTLLLIKKGAGTGEKIAEAVFGVYSAANDRKVGEITTGDDGEATIALAPGSYYLKELSVPSPFVPETARIPFTIRDVGVTVKIEASNTKGVGTALLEKKSTDGKAVPGSVFTLYRQDGTRIAELTTGPDGTASYELPVGSYYLVEKTAAVGYKLNTERYSFSIKHNEKTTVKAVNEPLVGTVEVYFRHVSDKRELAGMKSLTDRIGTDYIKWMREKGYENMPIQGYTLIRPDYPASLVLIDGVLTVTLWYDSPSTDKPGGPIEIPKTGGTFPGLPFALSGLCWLVAAFCAVTLVKGRSAGGQPASALATAGAAPIAEAAPEPPVPARTTTPPSASAKEQHPSRKKRKKGRR